MAQISINENQVIQLPDYTTSVNAADAAESLYEHLFKVASEYGGELTVNSHPAHNTHIVVWDGGPRQWAQTYAATVAAPLMSVSSPTPQCVVFADLH